jgi:hypothetical protein
MYSSRMHSRTPYTLLARVVMCRKEAFFCGRAKLQLLANRRPDGECIPRGDAFLCCCFWCTVKANTAPALLGPALIEFNSRGQQDDLSTYWKYYYL